MPLNYNAGGLLRLLWTIRRSNQSILKEINSEYSLEGLMLKLQYFGHLMWRADSPEKTLMLGKTEGKRKRGRQGNEMVRWHHWLNGRESEQTPGIGDGQGSLVCCSPWGSQSQTRLSDWTDGILRFLAFATWGCDVHVTCVSFVMGWPGFMCRCAPFFSIMESK